MKVFPDSAFFRERRAAALPTPAQVRDINAKNRGKDKVGFDRPPPVKIESLGLFIKYGTHVTVTEIRTQMMVREKLMGRVPVPEVFGWTQDQGQTFLYMSLVHGDPLHERWPTMTRDERSQICAELRWTANAWKSLKQDEDDCYIGSEQKQPLNNIFFTMNAEVVGPFQGIDAIQQFQSALGIDVVNPGPIVFTHNDLVACNILVGKTSARLAAIVDWGQAGWYPAYWEYCKARRVNVPDYRFFNEYEQEWKSEYLPRIVDAVDEETVWYPFLRFAMSKI
ncbi:phosphotransferase enzyme family protein [Xylaria cf. heliscus]|nr:phosphotransferase enzyme family protein [Xylaria cf. heliscus]